MFSALPARDAGMDGWPQISILLEGYGDLIHQTATERRNAEPDGQILVTPPRRSRVADHDEI